MPFRAAHTPSERSEFAQPDVALLLTHLSYYADGLTLVQFTETLKQLQRMGRNAQQEYYNSWLALMPQDKVALGELIPAPCRGTLQAKYGASGRPELLLIGSLLRPPAQGT